MDTDARTVFLAAVAAHLLADFCLQSDADVAAKRRFRFWAFFKHATIHAVAVYLFVGLWTLGLLPVVVLFSHLLIDGAKETVLRWLAPRDADDRPRVRWKFWSIVVDQLLHVAVLAIAVVFLSRLDLIPGEPYWCTLLGTGPWQKALVLLSGVVLAVYTGGVLIGVLVHPMLQEIRAAGGSNGLSPEQRGLEHGGRFIGQLERALILLFILTGQPAGVGFLIAAKSIFRFGELKDDTARKEAEYIIIGTLLSFAWALTIAWATHWALGATGA
ncbi:MAG TPA: DUF3307 domain-containing protein [Thermoguttaceae bacterium]|nr:DUF3307 domain-containing protein [Thermoguttaceae bacterium]